MRFTLPDGPWRRHYPFASQYAALGTGRMHYVTAGPSESSETLLCVHGNPTWSFHWRYLMQEWGRERQVIAIDHLGCGGSDRTDAPRTLADRIGDLCQFITTLDLANLTLVAQDWGGAIGLGALQKLRERFTRIVLFNTGAFPPPSIPLRIDVCRTPLLGRLALQGGNLFSRAALRMTMTRQRGLTADIAAGYLAPYNSWTNRRAVYDFVADIPRGPSHPTWQTLVDIEAGLPALASMPQLLVWGMRDWCFDPACLDRFLSHWPKAEAHRIVDAGHWVVEDAPDDCRALVTEFLNRT
jgi:cis-3-alkyl-4-acyloxetan-2-one decarboxylase